MQPGEWSHHVHTTSKSVRSVVLAVRRTQPAVTIAGVVALRCGSRSSALADLASSHSNRLPTLRAVAILGHLRPLVRRSADGQDAILPERTAKNTWDQSGGAKCQRFGRLQPWRLTLRSPPAPRRCEVSQGRLAPVVPAGRGERSTGLDRLRPRPLDSKKCLAVSATAAQGRCTSSGGAATPRTASATAERTDDLLAGVCRMTATRRRCAWRLPPMPSGARRRRTLASVPPAEPSSVRIDSVDDVDERVLE